MDHTERCQISGPLARVLRISSLLCVVPLQLTPLRKQTQCISLSGAQKANSGRLSYIPTISRKRQIIGYVLVFVILTLQVINLCKRLIFESESSKPLPKVCLTVITILSSTSILVTGFDGVNNMKRYMSYINKLEKINQKLESSLLDSQIKGSGFIIWGFISAFILLFGCHLFFKEFITWTSNKHGRSDFIAFAVDAGLLCKHMFNVMLCMQFVFLVCAVNVTLRTQNDRLRNLIFKLKLYDAMKTKNVANAHTTIRRLYRAHVSICEVVRSIDEGEGALVAILLLSKIMECTESFCRLISISYAPLEEWTNRKFVNLLVTLIWASFKGILIVLMAEHCHKTQEEFQTAQIHVSHLMCASADREFRDELRRFYNQVVVKTPAFSPLGICVLTRQLLAGIIGGIATLLAIFLQFHLIDSDRLRPPL